jgi:hypothetical protein
VDVVHHSLTCFQVLSVLLRVKQRLLKLGLVASKTLL